MIVDRPLAAAAAPARRTSSRSALVTASSRSCAIAAIALLLGMATASAQDVARPKIGLVLGGGGARGAAHIGVLEVLERLRIPVDCVAGTSMGALMAGAWVAGRSPAQMSEAMAQADWNDMFQDNPEFSELHFRNKQLQQRFLPGSETGIHPGGAVTPPGVVLGQKIKLFFNQLVGADRGEPEIEQLPLPLSIVATDIGTGERVIYRDGSLTQAMRASMSVPGLIAPTHYRGRRLVDGGLVDNLPIAEVREGCGAQVVIAVDVGTAPLPGEQVNGLLGITAQVITLLTQQNVNASIATLTPADVYIKPDLGTITAGDFTRHADAARRGREAADAMLPRLAGLGATDAQFAEWRSRLRGSAASLPRIDDVEVTGLVRADAALLRRNFEPYVGQPLDTKALTGALMRTYGDGYYENVDYTVQSVNGRNVLRVMPVEKSWGPDYLRFGLQLETDLRQGSSYQLRAGYQKTWLNALGGELLATAEVGNRTGLGVNWFQPVSTGSGLFLDTSASWSRERTDFFFYDQRVAEYRTTRVEAEVLAGYSVPRKGQVRAGWRAARATNVLDTGIDIFSVVPTPTVSGWKMSLDVDQFDRIHFPRKGWSAQASWFEARNADYSMQKLELRGAVPVDEFVLGARVAWTGSLRGTLPLVDAAKLGGFLNLTGYSTNQFIGDDALYGHLRAERIIGRLPLGLRGDMRIGVALEAGRFGEAYTLVRGSGWLGSLAVYLGGETPLGPAYVGIGRGRGGSTNAYLFIGTP